MGTGCAVCPLLDDMNDESPFSGSSCLETVFSELYSELADVLVVLFVLLALFTLLLSGVPSFGGVGGKLNEPEVAIEVAGCTERGVVPL